MEQALLHSASQYIAEDLMSVITGILLLAK